MTAYSPGVTVKSLYYIEIHGIKARPDSTFDGVFASLTKFTRRSPSPQALPFNALDDSLNGSGESFSKLNALFYDLNETFMS
jgi:hypothetical protein